MLFLFATAVAPNAPVERDVVYGSSPPALTAAISVQKGGKSVVIVSHETPVVD